MEIDVKSQVTKYIEDFEDKLKNAKFGTKAIHCGQEPEIINGGVSVPIDLSTTFCQSSPSNPYGPYDYTRCGNPTRSHLERLMCGLENTKYSIIFSSGMAAITAVIHLFKTGDHVLCIDDVYGGTQRYFRQLSNPKHGIDYTFIDFSDIELIKKNITEKTKLIWLESPTNPTLKTTDLALVVKTVKEISNDILIAVDNTFLTPYNCRPIDFGVDIVMESATKYLGGHSDVLMGTLCLNNKEIYDQIYFSTKSLGALASPFDCYMAIRGIKTLHLRVERHNFNALKVAQFLESHKNVEKVLYPGLESSEYHKIAKSQQVGFGGVLSFYIKGGLDESRVFLQKLKYFTLAESLGATESLAEHPALMTHYSVPPEIRKQLGIGDNLIRLSVGCEDVEDLISDIDNALQ